MIRFGIYTLLFTGFIPGQDLETVWPELNDIQKHAVSRQVGRAEIASIFPRHSARRCLGRWLQVCQSRIPCQFRQFENFHFAGSRTASSVYIHFLRPKLSHSSPPLATPGIRLPPISLDSGMSTPGWPYWSVSRNGSAPRMWVVLASPDNLARNGPTLPMNSTIATNQAHPSMRDLGFESPSFP